jgi:hypothetical protein
MVYFAWRQPKVVLDRLMAWIAWIAPRSVGMDQALLLRPCELYAPCRHETVARQSVYTFLNSDTTGPLAFGSRPPERVTIALTICRMAPGVSRVPFIESSGFFR